MHNYKTQVFHSASLSKSFHAEHSRKPERVTPYHMPSNI